MKALTTSTPAADGVQAYLRTAAAIRVLPPERAGLRPTASRPGG